MAVRGSGPSRRSHTKSRKGCKTCKRRHIRCDESFPQCRNCTKHHVRCDYQDTTTPDIDGIYPASARVSPTPTSDDGRTGSYLPSDASHLSDSSYMAAFEPEQSLGTNPELIHNLRSIADALDSRGAGDLSAWVPMMRRAIHTASTNSYLMDALKAFSASQIAWVSQSPAAREQSIEYSTSALAGLHQAVGEFNKDNADAVLVTSISLICQSRDWLSWSSLQSGIISIAAAMRPWDSETHFPDFVKAINVRATTKAFNPPPKEPIPSREHTLNTMMSAMQLLRACVSHRPLELHWVDQFIDLVSRFQTTEAPTTDEEQFNHLYVLRKWILWLPITLLQDGMVDEFNLAAIANLYAIAIALSTHMPIANTLVSRSAASTLINVLKRYDNLQGQSFHTVDMSQAMQYPREALAYYVTWNDGIRPLFSQEHLVIPQISTLHSEDAQDTENLSPAFSLATFSRSHHRASSAASAFLEVPTTQTYYVPDAGLGLNTSQWAAFPSPSFPTTDDFADDSFNQVVDPFQGYTLPCEIWI